MVQLFEPNPEQKQIQGKQFFPRAECAKLLDEFSQVYLYFLSARPIKYLNGKSIFCVNYSYYFSLDMHKWPAALISLLKTFCEY